MPATLATSIRLLPAQVANQIAAGEVVERPASVVKELVENALDAGATRIHVELEQGGVELVRVTDDGTGIVAAELLLAITPHATSKIAAAADLDRIATLGFRGEALASIASVSRLSIRSRTRDDDGATLLDTEGGTPTPPRPAPGPPGTCVTVRNLFFNTPARRKFLRTTSTEQERCLDAVRSLALAHPAVAFAATVDGRAVLDLPPGQSPRERALAVLGKELGPQLLDAHADQYDDTRGIALWGLVGTPTIARGSNKSQHIFVNGRPVRDRTIQHALNESYRGLIDPSRFPTAVLMLELSPEGVDVNVHPQKTEVRFRDGSMVHSVVLRAVRQALAAADLTPRIGELKPASAGLPADLPGAGIAPGGIDRFVDYFKRPTPAATPIDFGVMKESLAPAPPEPAAVPEPVSRVLQVHKSYLVTQDDQGVVIIDQHALHERVMFEYLLTRVLAGTLESQRLLAPAAVPATPTQMDRLAELAPLLTRLGIAAEPLGPGTLGVHAFPSFLFDRGVDPLDFMEGLITRADDPAFYNDARRGGETALRDVLDMMSCKAAVKAGDRLSIGELDELVKLRGEVERSSNCPHGRPTSIRLTIKDLERLFGRS